MADEISEPVKKVCAMLKNASSDTEKFAALFLVTKLVRSKDCRAKAKKAIFEAIGFNFLKRLLLTTDVPVDCPPVVYKSVALSVLTCFCNEQELATHPEMLENIPVFLDIVEQADNTDYDDNLIVVREAYVCLKCISAYEPGQKALFEVGAIQKMSAIYSHQSFQTDEALNILVSLVTRFGASSWGANPKQFHVIVNKIALDFETDHTERKFELCTILNSLLFTCPREAIASTASEESWSGSIYKGLTDILTSKIGKAQRNPALELASTILDVLGVEWALSDEENPKKFFLLLLQLAAIEIRMQMDNKSFKQAFTEARLVTACFIILEISINYIATDQLDLEQKEKQQIYTGLKGAFSGILSVLQKISLDKNKDSLPSQEKLYVCAMVRVLVAWLAQETSAMRDQVYKLLPFILSIANETFYASKARRVAEKAGTAMETETDPIGQVDVLRIMLPAMCHLTVEDQARKLMLSSKEEDVLYDCMQFHWSIVHYKKPPVPKAERLKQKTQPERELTPKILEEMKDSRAAIISICNIFMNITVLEPKMVEDSKLFNTLMFFIFTELPELKGIPENLVLQGNLAVLGMLLLKQQSNKIKKNDFSICRYIQSTIRFLWDAYIVDESNDPSALVVSIAYKEYWFELMELWFLGMQTMSGVLSQIPWISEFAIESGWAEGIIETLKKVKIGTLQPNVKSAYEDFLCHLVDANNSVASVLKKADALKVCRNHRLMELGKKLFDLLAENYGIVRDTATSICSSYLKAFRKCPDNPAVNLDEWRHLLWRQALHEEYSHLAHDVYLKWLQLRYHYLALLPEVKSLLIKLRQHYLLGLITNGPSCAQWEKVQRLDLQSYFDVILVSGDLPWEKPNCKIFEQACTYLGVEAQNCIMVGDKLETDIQGGIEAHLGGTVWIPLSETDMNSNEIEPRPDFTINSVTDLPNLLPNNMKSPVFRSKSVGMIPNAGRMQHRLLSLPDLEDCNSNSSDGS